MNEIETKPVYQSKLVWFNAVYSIGEIAALLLDVMPETWLPYLIAVQGIVSIVLRIWFTNQAVTFRSGN